MLALAGWNSARYMKLTGLYICTVLYCLPRLVEYRPGAWNELDCIVILMLKFVYGTVKFKTSKGISSFHFWKVACQIHIGSLLAGLVANYSGRCWYQHNEDDFWNEFWFIPSFYTAWINKNVETKRSCQLKKLLFNYNCNFVIRKSLLTIKTNKTAVFIILILSLTNVSAPLLGLIVQLRRFTDKICKAIMA